VKLQRELGSGFSPQINFRQGQSIFVFIAVGKSKSGLLIPAQKAM
jgi:hypothetical protein